MNSPNETHPAVRIGHVHLRVADLEQAMVFYCNVPGFAVTAHGPDYSLPGTAFLACRARKDDQKEQPSPTGSPPSTTDKCISKRTRGR